MLSLPLSVYLLYLNSGVLPEFESGISSSFFLFHTWLEAFEQVQEFKGYIVYDLKFENTNTSLLKKELKLLNNSTNSVGTHKAIEANLQLFWQNLEQIAQLQTEQDRFYITGAPLHQLSRYSGLLHHLRASSPQTLPVKTGNFPVRLPRANQNHNAYLGYLLEGKFGVPELAFFPLIGNSLYLGETDSLETSGISAQLLTKYHISNLAVGASIHKVKILQLHHLALLRFWCEIEQLWLSNKLERKVEFLHTFTTGISNLYTKPLVDFLDGVFYPHIRIKILELMFLYPTTHGKLFIDLFHKVFLQTLADVTYIPNDFRNAHYGLAFDIATITNGIAEYQPLEVLNHTFVSQDRVPLPIFNKDLGLYNATYFLNSMPYPVETGFRSLPFHNIFTVPSFQIPHFGLTTTALDTFLIGIPLVQNVETLLEHSHLGNITVAMQPRTVPRLLSDDPLIIVSENYQEFRGTSFAKGTPERPWIGDVIEEMGFVDGTTPPIHDFLISLELSPPLTTPTGTFSKGSSRYLNSIQAAGQLNISRIWENISLTYSTDYFNLASPPQVLLLPQRPYYRNQIETFHMFGSKHSSPSYLTTKTQWITHSQPSQLSFGQTTPFQTKISNALPELLKTQHSPYSRLKEELTLLDGYCRLFVDQWRGPLRKLPIRDLLTNHSKINRINETSLEQISDVASLDAQAYSLVNPNSSFYNNTEYLDPSKFGDYNIRIGQSPEKLLGLTGKLANFNIADRESSTTVVVPIYFTTFLDLTGVTTTKLAAVSTYSRPLLID